MLRPTIYSTNFVDNIFDDFFNDSFFTTSAARSVNQMSTDVKDCGDHYQIDMDLPGFSRENVQAELKDGYLTIHASRSTSNDEKDENGRYIRRERYSGQYQRSFFVGKSITQQDIRARFADGVLTLDVPKEDQKPKVEENHYITIEG